MKEQIDFHGQVRPQSFGRRVRAFLRKGEEGQALVEIALTLPAMFAVLTAIFAFAIGFSNQLTLTSAVGFAGQYLQTARSSTADPCADAMTALKQAAPTLNPAKINLTLNLNGTVESGSSCTSGAAIMNAKSFQGDPVTVTATYPLSLPILNFKTAPGWVLSATVTEYSY
jgi:Flp pilus assembly protein TadG